MCGIAGFAGFDNHRLLEAMMDTLVHRGPDDEGFYVDKHVSLGMRRLSIIDVQGGHALARPVVATGVSDLPEILEGCGRIIPPDDPEALCAAMEKVFSDPVRAEDLGHKARQRFLDHYSWDVMQGILDGVFRPFM
jgi:glycosyltransferase involved in cell wall biosynthesis